MIEKAIAILQEAGFDLTARELADILWLAGYLETSPQIQLQQEEVPIPVISSPETVSNNKPQNNTPNTKEVVSSEEITEPAAEVYLPPSQPDTASTIENQEAIPIKIPAAVALRNALALGRALRPLMRKVPSSTEKILDEEATVYLIAEANNKIKIPVFQPAPEKWLELALVVERTSTTPIWEQTIQELQELLKYQGAFRDVRTWELRGGGEGERGRGGEWEKGGNGDNDGGGSKLQLFSQNSNGGYDSTPYSPNILMDPKGRRLILLVSDCISPAWRNKLIYPVLESWGKHGLLTILHLLPEKLWSRTALAQETPVLLSSLQPGAFNSQLISQIWDEDYDIKEIIQNQKSLSAACPVRDIIQNISVPIITLEPEPLFIWSQVIAGQGNISTAGFKFSPYQNSTLQSKTNTQQLTSSELVSRFRATASLQARRLAGLLASAPVSISIVNLIQQTLLPESTQIHVAEMFMSGMLRSLLSSQQNDADYIEYEFVDDEVRKLLRDFVPSSKTLSVLDAVSEFIAKRVGLSVKAFEARLRIPSSEANDDLETKIRPFATLKAQVLEQLGGIYAQKAQELKASASPKEIPAEILDVSLQKFTFETVTVNRHGEIIKRETKAAHYFRENLGKGINLEMIAIPGGTFMMGSPEGEGRDNEKPQHEVTVSPFFMGKYPITQVQWKAVARLPRIERELKANPSHFKGNNLPVENICWYDAVEFCARLAKNTGKNYRLPSEAEWEYACRANTITPFSFGDTLTNELANYNSQKTTPVGSFYSNSFGLFDMHGNVYEWCLDDLHNDYQSAPNDSKPWINANNDNDNYCFPKSLRGGCWNRNSKFCRSAFLDGYFPHYVSYDIGFRVIVGVALGLNYHLPFYPFLFTSKAS